MPTIDADGIRLTWRETGTGAPVLALHSSASTGGQWRALGEAMKHRFRLLSPDLPGYGQSRHGDDASRPDLGREAAALAQLVEDCDEPAHVIGHSYGGALAVKLALDRPDLVASLVVIEPALFHLLRDNGGPDWPLFREIREISGGIAAANMRNRPAEGMARFIDFWSGGPAWAGLPEDARRGFLAMAATVQRNFTALYAERWQLCECRRITCPSLFMLGLASLPLAQRITEMLAETAPNARLVMVPDAGHMLPVTHPDWVNPLILAHLERAETAAVIAGELRGVGLGGIAA